MFLEAGQAPAGAQYSSLIMLVVMIAFLYFFMIRPQKKREKEVQTMRDALKAGDEIVTIGGIQGKVLTAKEDYLVIELKPHKTQMQIAKWAVANVVKEGKAKAETIETDEPEVENKEDSEKKR